MSGAAQRKLPKTQRRGQLLETALMIVQEEGTDALTLRRLAERAGVSKPIAYEHFNTRAGLLMALYQEIDARHITTMLEAVSQAPRRLEDVAYVVSEAYMVSIDPQAHAIAAALQGDGEMDSFHQDLFDNYVKLSSDMLAPYANLTDESLHLHCVGLVGAAEAISGEMIRGRITKATAIATLASLIIKTLAASNDEQRAHIGTVPMRSSPQEKN